MSIPRRIATVLEIVAVFVGGLLAGRAAINLLGLRSSREYIASLPSDAAPDLLRLAGEVAAGHLIRYGILLTLAFSTAYWLAGHRLRDYGITPAGPWSEHLRNGVVAAALTALPAECIQLASERWFTANRPAAWRLIDRVPWDWKFWLYMAVSSYLLVPIVEELTFRGWMQTRLASAFGGPTGIVLTAVVFAVSHTQYIGANVLSIILLMGTLFGAVVLGVVRDLSGSLAPAILAHAVLNIPARGAGSFAVIAVSAVIIVIMRHRVGRLLSRLMDTLRNANWLDLAWGSGTIAAIAAIVLAFRNYAVVVVALAAIAALLLYNAPPRRSSP